MNRYSIALAVLLLVGCGGTGSASTDTASETETPATSTNTKTPVTSTDTADEDPEPTESAYVADVDDWKIRIKVTEKQCFGSAGCNLVVQPKMTYVGEGEIPDAGTLDVTFEVTGDESGQVIATVTADLEEGTYSYDEIILSTTSSSVDPKAKITEVEYENL